MTRKHSESGGDLASEAAGRSYLGPTIRRSLRSGRIVLIGGTAWSVLLGVSIAVGSGSGFDASFPLILPIFGSIAAIGALTVFTSDRTRGVLEYLMAYGISPRQLFTNFIVAALASISIVDVIAIGSSVGVYVALGNPLSTGLLLLLGAYAIPMSFVAGAFATTVGMYWSALSSPREGMNSPLGIAPFLGILPPVGVLVLIGVFGATVGLTTDGFLLVTGAALTLVALTVLYLLANIGHLLRRERLLSNV
ncbi:MAG TPA: hypothetical protein VGP88_02475 [Thermoplasmata archaeon]|jgi:hypothetical protein|nr:hypothetical protein [Thermoplasmata archaeon]